MIICDFILLYCLIYARAKNIFSSHDLINIDWCRLIPLFLLDGEYVTAWLYQHLFNTFLIDIHLICRMCCYALFCFFFFGTTTSFTMNIIFGFMNLYVCFYKVDSILFVIFYLLSVFSIILKTPWRLTRIY